MSYFICRRAFRDAKGPVSTGSVIDPVEIKRFRFRLQERHIVEVTEQNFEQYATLFEQRYGITIPKLDEVPSKESDEEKQVLEATEKAKKEAKATTVAKATAKAKVTENK
jgi:hypothetical protein